MGFPVWKIRMALDGGGGVITIQCDSMCVSPNAYTPTLSFREFDLIPISVRVEKIF